MIRDGRASVQVLKRRWRFVLSPSPPHSRSAPPALARAIPESKHSPASAGFWPDMVPSEPGNCLDRPYFSARGRLRNRPAASARPGPTRVRRFIHMHTSKPIRRHPALGKGRTNLDDSAARGSSKVGWTKRHPTCPTMAGCVLNAMPDDALPIRSRSARPGIVMAALESLRPGLRARCSRAALDKRRAIPHHRIHHPVPYRSLSYSMPSASRKRRMTLACTASPVLRN